VGGKEIEDGVVGRRLVQRCVVHVAELDALSVFPVPVIHRVKLKVGRSNDIQGLVVQSQVFQRNLR